MPGVDELMAMQQGGSGGAPQMPPGGGDPRMAQAMQQKLAQLMQDPAARAGIQAHMQGGDPRAAGAQVAMQDPRMGAAMRGVPPDGFAPGRTEQLAGGGSGAFSSPTTDRALYESQEANQGVRGNLPPIPDKGGMTGYHDEDAPEDPRQTPMPMKPGEEQNMVSQEIDRKGATFDGNEAPTKNDIERLVSDPTPQAVKAFDMQFGEGAADKYLEEDFSENSPDGAKAESIAEPLPGDPDYK